jgi:SAM-dependent methyltransferase
METVNPEINVDEIMQRIREEVARRKAAMGSMENQTGTEAAAASSINWSSGTSDTAPVRVQLPRPTDLSPPFKRKPSYSLADFLNYHDEDFLRNAYRGILGREPDAEGFHHYLERLRSGSLSKVDILGRLRYSPEGRALKARIVGLSIPFAFRTLGRVPLVGYGIRWVDSILRLPLVIRNLERIDVFTSARFASQQQQALAFTAQLEQALSAALQQIDKALEQKATAADVEDLDSRVKELFEQVQDLLEEKADKADLGPEFDRMRSEIEQKANKAEIAQVQDLLEEKADKADLGPEFDRMRSEIEQKANKAEIAQALESAHRQLGEKANSRFLESELKEIHRQILDHKRNILDQQRRLALLLEEARKRLPKPLAPEQLKAMADEEEHLLDAFYVTFEDQFRGTREDIKRRAEVYLPIVKAAGAGTAESPILDIGCGRGEWLELLKENGLVARGIDLNRIMMNQCQELGLDVLEAEAINYLRGLKPNTLGAITGLHIIEHLPFRTLITLFDETLRVLKPDGVAIYETPNPENLIVGACNFYYDPTHRNPLPPPIVQFTLEARGFRRVEIRRLTEHRLEDSLELLEDSFTGASQINPIIQLSKQFYFTAPDYAAISYKT